MAGWKSADKGKSIVTGFYIEKKDTNSFNKNIKPTLKALLHSINLKDYFI